MPSPPSEATGVAKSGRIRVGIGGWVYEPWRGAFYPDGLAQKRELEYAAGRLTAIEINGTYYGSQKPDSFARWRDETPDDFVFTLKGPRFATNRRVLAEAGPSVERFVTGGLAELGQKLGPINWQFMPTKAFDPDDFAAFLELLPRKLDGRPLRHAVEVRHPSFRAPDFVALARAHEVAVVVAGDSAHPVIADVTAPLVYIRAMGSEAAEPLGYSAAALDRWAGRARAWAEGGAPDDPAPVAAQPAGRTPRDVFLFFISGHKVCNPAAAMALIDRIDGKRGET
jgi:uncharacterized protein YecE (DUF72 family)